MSPNPRSARAPEPLPDLHDRRRLALDAEVDLRTLQRALAGQAVKPLSLRRIKRALAAAGLSAILPDGRR